MAEQRGMPRLVQPGWTDRVDLGDGRAILFYGDGSARFEHVCHRTRGADGWTVVDAPLLALGAGHEIVQRDPLTIRASLACGDCATHGWVTDGTWGEA